MATINSKTAKKFVPITEMEVQNYDFAFYEWLKANVSPEAASAFSSIGFLGIAVRHGLTLDGQKTATKARNNLNKFLGVKHV